MINFNHFRAFGRRRQILLVGAGVFSSALTFKTPAAGDKLIPAALTQSNCVPASAGLVSWWRAEGDASNAVGTAHGTLFGGVSFAPGRVGSAFSFDGVNGAINLPDDPALALTHSLTIEGWLFLTNAPSVEGKVIFRGDTRSGLDPYGVSVFPGGGGATLISFGVTDPANTVVALSSLMPIGAWTHVAATLDDATGIMRLFTNGVVAAQTTTTLRPLGALDPAFHPGIGIGNHSSEPGPFNYPFRGLIDELSVYSRALSIDEVLAIYNAGNAGKCTAPTSCAPAPTGLVTWWRAEGSPSDSIGVANGTLFGGVSFAPGRVGSAFSFDGVNGAINVPDVPALALTHSLSIEGWLFVTNTPVAQGMVIFRGDTRSGLDPYEVYVMPGGGGSTVIGFGMTDPGNNVASLTSLMPTGHWTHFAATLDDATGAMRLYTNGVVAAQTTTTLRPLGPLDPAFQPGIGIGNHSSQPSPFNYPFRGLIDELSVYGRALTTEEVQGIYAAGSAGKCVGPNNCVAPPADLAGWWPLEGNGNDIAGGNSGVVSGNAVFSAAEVGSGLSCAGTEGIIVSNNASLNFGPGVDFSIECWVMPLVASTAYGVLSLVDKRVTPDDFSSVGYSLALGDGVLGFQMSESVSKTFLIVRAAGPDLRDGAWHHVAVTVHRTTSDGGHLYVDGQPALTFDPTSEQGDLSTSTPFLIALHASYPRIDANYRGIIDEVSIYRRALSGGEIQGIYTAGSAGKCPGGVRPSIDSQPAGATVNVGAPVTFTVTASGTQPLGYQWFKGQSAIGGATATAYTIADVQLGDAGSYSVVVSNAYGSISSSNAVLAVIAPGTNCTPTPAGLVSWWRAQGDANDSAGGAGGTLFGGVSFAAGKVGTAFSFDGVNGAINVPDVPALALTQSLTIEGWLYLTGAPSGVGMVIFRGDTRPGLDPYQVYVTPGAGGSAVLGFGMTDSGQNVASLTSPMPTGSWVHVAATLDDATGSMKLYTNGVIAVQTTTSVRPLGPLDPAFHPGIGIGNHSSQPSPFNYPFRGLIDELSVYNRALAVAEIQAIFTAANAGKCPGAVPPSIQSQPVNATVNVGDPATFTVTAFGTPPLGYQWFKGQTAIGGATATSYTIPDAQLGNAGSYSVIVSNAYGSIPSSNAVLVVITPETNCTPVPTGLVSWWRAQGDANDSAGGAGGTLFGGASFAAGRVGTAFSFDGINGAINVPDAPALALTQSLTIEGWLFLTSAPSTLGMVIFRGDTRSGLDPYQVDVRPGAGNTALVGFAMTDPGNNVAFLSALMPIGAWTHVGATLDDASGLMSLYTNGVIAVQTTTAVRPLGALDPAFHPGIGIGNHSSQPSPFNYPFHGLIDELSVYSRALSIDEVRAVYNAGSAGKCEAPANCVPAPAGLVSWWPLEGDGNDVAGSNSGIVSGNAVFAAAEVGSGLSCAGTEGIIVSNNASLNFGPGVDFSIECWVKPLVASTAYGVLSLVDKRVTPNDFSAVGYSLALGDGVLGFQMSESVSKPWVLVRAAGPDLRDGAWHHVAVTVHRTTSDGGTLYVDGQAALTFDPTSEQGDLSTSTPFLIALHASYPRIDANYRGIIDEVSIYRRALSSNEIQGIYTAGSAGKCAVKPGNVPPVPVIEVSPLARFAGYTNLIIIAPDNTNAAVTLDGSKSYDPDGAHFLYAWSEGPTLFGTNAVVSKVLAVGTHVITLKLDDTLPLGVSTSNATVEVISPSDAVAILIEMVDGSKLPRRTKSPLDAHLRTTAAAFDRESAKAAMNMLGAFENLVDARVTPFDAVLAEQLKSAAEAIINALTPSTGPKRGQLPIARPVAGTQQQ